MSDKPRKPDESECCGSGCNPCILDVYEQQLKKWEARALPPESKYLSQVRYLPFLVTDIVNISDCIKTIQFGAVVLKNEHHNGVIVKNASTVDYETAEDSLNIQPGMYIIMKGIFHSANEDVTISRAYTPILDKDSFTHGKFTIIISLQPKGKMSQFLESLRKNDIVFCRGPYQEITYEPNSFKQVLLIGGGTGVVPLYNISKSIVENDKDDTFVHVLCSFKTVNDILLRTEFRSLAHYWNFQLTVFVSNEDGAGFQPRYREEVVFRRIDHDVIKDKVETLKNDVLVMVCGPMRFNEFVKDSLLKCGVKDESILIYYYFVV